MYDIGTKLVNRLKGELSSAFVDVAESNAKAQEDDSVDEATVSLTDSGIYEKMPALNSDHEKITIIEAHSADSPDRPLILRDVSNRRSDEGRRVSISTGYSVIKR